MRVGVGGGVTVGIGVGVRVGVGGGAMVGIGVGVRPCSDKGAAVGIVACDVLASVGAAELGGTAGSAASTVDNGGVVKIAPEPALPVEVSPPPSFSDPKGKRKPAKPKASATIASSPAQRMPFSLSHSSTGTTVRLAATPIEIEGEKQV